jgi:hypothetical protein
VHSRIWLDTLPLNLTYISIVPSNLSLGNPPHTNSLHSTIQISSPYSNSRWINDPRNGTHPIQTPYFPQSKSQVRIPSLGSFIQRICPGPRLCLVFVTNLFFMVKGC